MTQSGCVALVGEAYGAEEERLGRPFVGPSGYELDQQLAQAGISRGDCFVTNVTNNRPPANEIKAWFARKSEFKREGLTEIASRFPRQPILDGLRALQVDLAAHQPRLIVALGDTALWALTGETGIMKWRGSILQTGGGPIRHQLQPIKVIPTVHPAAVLREMPLRALAIADLKRAAYEATFPEVRRPQWSFTIPRSAREIHEWMGDNYGTRWHENPLVADVENVIGTGELICLGFAASPTEAICIPFMHRTGDNPHYWSTAAEEHEITLYCRDILTKTPMVFHNGLHDCQIIAKQWGFMPRFEHDTMVAQHVAYPGLLGGKIDPITGRVSKKGSSLSLSFCSSMYCRYHRFWKCVQPDVEILTRSGWIPFSSFDDGSIVEAMVSTESAELSWAECSVIKQPFNGQGIRIVGDEHNCWYTPNHKVLGNAPLTKKRVYTAGSIPKAFRLITSGIWKGDAGDIKPALLRLIVAIQADGAIDSRSIQRGNPRVQFNLRKQRKQERLFEIISQFDPEHLSFLVYPGGAKRDRLEICLRGAAVNEALSILGPEKQFDRWLLHFSADMLDLFLEELPYWDGWFFGNARYYSSRYFNNVEWVATIGHLRGLNCHIMPLHDKKTDSTAFKVSIKEKGSWVRASTEEYIGNVYCLKTPTGFFLARSNDHIFITGNSDGRGWDPEVDSEEKYWRYNCEDTVRTYEVHNALQSILTKRNLLTQYRSEMQLFGPVFEMMFRGMRFDDERRKAFRHEVDAERIETQRWIDTAVGHPLNCSSTPQMRALFYDDFRLPPILHRKTKQPTLDDHALELISKRKPVLRPLIERIQHLRSLDVYQENFLDVKLAADSRLHVAMNIAGAETMRFSSNTNAFGEGFNGQNLPRD